MIILVAFDNHLTPFYIVAHSQVVAAVGTNAPVAIGIFYGVPIEMVGFAAWAFFSSYW